MRNIVIILVVLLLLLVSAALTWAFSLAFVRRRKRVVVNESLDESLKPYHEMIMEGMHYLDTTQYRRVSTQSYDGLRLAGRYYSCGSDRTVIVFHGYRSSARRDYSCAVKMYQDMGLNVLLVDQRSHGESEGKLITFGVKERRDVLSWIHFVLEEYGQDMQIFLSGLSMGASTVMMAASLQLPENVKGIIADCGFTSPADIIGRVAYQNFHINGSLAASVLDVLSRVIGRFSLYEMSTPQILANSDIPILFIHGKSDDFVPCEMSERSYAAARGPKEVCFVEGAGHGMAYLIDRESVEAALKKFFDTYSA